MTTGVTKKDLLNLALDIGDMLAKKREEEKTCQGMIFKLVRTAYVTQRGFAFKDEYVHMKRLSCHGCEYCGWQYDIDWTCVFDMGGYEIPDNTHDGDLFRLGIVNQSRDWETGIVDDWDIALVPYSVDIEEKK